MTRRVLVIDDNPDGRVLASRVLNRVGERAVCVASGAGAMELLQRERPKLVLLDLDMPEMDGCAVPGRIRGDPRPRGPAGRRVQRGDREDLLAAVACGANDYLRKGSCSMDDIRRSVRQGEESDEPQQRTDLN